MLPSKTQMMTVAFTLVALAAINNVGALAPVKKVVSGQ